MPLRLQNGVSFCVVNQHLVFLDIRADRYYGLPNPFNKAKKSDHTIADLHRLGLVEGEGEFISLQPFQMSGPVLDCPDTLRSPVAASASAFALHMISAARLKHHRFFDVIARLNSMKAAGKTIDMVPSRVHLQCAAAFRACAPFFNQQHACLTRSLALMEMLYRRGAPATLVIGVKMNPFAAHAWVQVGRTLLNERLEIARLHQPIASF